MLFVDPEEIQPLVDRVRMRDQKAIRQLIEIHIPLARVIARRYSRTRINQRGDIRASAYLGVVEAVNKIAEGHGTDGQITPYIGVYIRRFIRDFIVGDNTVPIDTRKKKITIPMTYSINAMQSSFVQSEDFALNFKAVDSNVHEAIEYEELERMLNLNEVEKRVLDQRIDGHTLEEIAEGMGHRKNWAKQVLEKVAARYIRVPGVLKPRRMTYGKA